MVFASMGTCFTPFMLERLYAMLGDVSTTAIVTVSRADPIVKFRVIAYLVATTGSVGVPVMSPVELFTKRPAGKEPQYVSPLPRIEPGTLDEIGTFLT